MELLVILDKSPFSVQIPTFRIQLLSEQQHVKKIHELHHSDHKKMTIRFVSKKNVAITCHDYYIEAFGRLQDLMKRTIL